MNGGRYEEPPTTVRLDVQSAYPDDERTTIVEVMAFCDCPFCQVEHESKGGPAERDGEASPES